MYSSTEVGIISQWYVSTVPSGCKQLIGKKKNEEKM